MHLDEARIQQSGLDVNIVDLLIFDSIEFYMSRVEFHRQWTDIDGVPYCWVNVEQVLAFNHYRLQGICNNERAIRRKIAKLVELGLLIQHKHNSKTLLTQGPMFKLLSNKFDMAELSGKTPTLAEVEEYFKSCGYSNAKRFFDYNEERGWLYKGCIANDIIWHSWAKIWAGKQPWFDRMASRKNRAAKTSEAKVVSVTSRLPLSLSPDRFAALGPEYKEKYKESKDRGGNVVYILRAS